MRGVRIGGRSRFDQIDSSEVAISLCGPFEVAGVCDDKRAQNTEKYAHLGCCLLSPQVSFVLQGEEHAMEVRLAKPPTAAKKGKKHPNCPDFECPRSFLCCHR